MKDLDVLFENNRAWVKKMLEGNPNFFTGLTERQTPEYLWIGCADSRVPANEILGLMPGDVFVHRNVANLVVHSDLNCLSVIQYAVYVLKIKHIIVCGHYGCGGVAAIYRKERLGLIDNWLMHIKDTSHKYRNSLALIENREDKVNKLCELNVIEQALNVANTTVVRSAWERNQQLSVHALIYRLSDGILRNLQFSVSSADDIDRLYNQAVEQISGMSEPAGK